MQEPSQQPNHKSPCAAAMAGDATVVFTHLAAALPAPYTQSGHTTPDSSCSVTSVLTTDDPYRLVAAAHKPSPAFLAVDAAVPCPVPRRRPHPLCVAVPVLCSAQP